MTASEWCSGPSDLQTACEQMSHPLALSASCATAVPAHGRLLSHESLSPDGDDDVHHTRSAPLSDLPSVGVHCQDTPGASCSAVTLPGLRVDNVPSVAADDYVESAGPSSSAVCPPVSPHASLTPDVRWSNSHRQRLSSLTYPCVNVARFESCSRTDLVARAALHGLSAYGRISTDEIRNLLVAYVCRGDCFHGSSAAR